MFFDNKKKVRICFLTTKKRFEYLLITDPSDSFDRKHNGNVEKINHFYDFDENHHENNDKQQ